VPCPDDQKTPGEHADALAARLSKMLDYESLLLDLAASRTRED